MSDYIKETEKLVASIEPVEEVNTNKKGFEITGTDEDIHKCLIKATKTVIGWKNVDPSRLKRQLSVMKSIIKGLKKGKKNFIILAPTGFGKTILGLMVSEFIKECVKAKIAKGGGAGNTYLLTPNKFLQDQYQEDIEKFELSKTHAQMKGQSNYPCIENPSVTFANRPCDEHSVKSLPKKMHCGTKCPYVLSRIIAEKSRTTVLNYSYFLTSMNYVYEDMGASAPFTPRTLTVFDECHTISGIVQDMFGDDFDFKDKSYEMDSVYKGISMIYGDKLNEYTDMFNSVTDSFGEHIGKTINYFDELYSKMPKMISQFNRITVKKGSDYEELFSKILGVKPYADKVLKVYTELMMNEFPLTDDGESIDTSLLDKRQKEIFKYTTDLGKFLMKLNIVKLMFESIGYDSMAVTTKLVEVRTKGGNRDKRQVLVFRCVRFDELIRRYVLKYTDISIFMSATIGHDAKSMQEFSKTHGIDEDSYLIINESDFDFSKSPIIQTMPALSMSYKNKDENMPKLLARIDKIVKLHPKEAGLIHTGSYAFMDMLESYAKANGIDGRFIWCRNAKQKIQGVEQLKWDIKHVGWTNRILVGASLLEGVDLKDELCRFTIFMKVPFPSLGDEVVKKMKSTYGDEWYRWSTMQQVVQGIGRSNRHKTDYSTIYLMDGSFVRFLNNMYGGVPKHISDRMTQTHISSLFDDFVNETAYPPQSPMLVIPVEARAYTHLENDFRVLEEWDEQGIKGGSKVQGIHGDADDWKDEYS